MEATPPRGDPIYTEMIGTLGLFGTFYMSREDMDFCAMRLYSNFKQAQENMERHAILDSIDVRLSDRAEALFFDLLSFIFS